jgi:hypothetical protein
LKKKIILILILTIIISITPITATDNDFLIKSFSNNILISFGDNTYIHHVEPTIAISGNGILFAGWKNAYTHDGAGVRVSFSKSIDNGASWSYPLFMPNFIPNTGQSDPWLVWYEPTETLFYAYLEYSLDNEVGFSQITVAKSEDYGETWSLAAASHGIGFADKETMTVSSNGLLYVAYDDINSSSGATYVRLTRSDDNGSTFNEISLIADSITNPEDHLAPYVTTDNNNNVFIAWMWFTDSIWGDIYITSSNDQGLTFTSPIDINSDSQNSTFEVNENQRPSKGSLPVIRFDQNDRLYVLWAEKYEFDGLWDIYLRYSDDFGLTWSNRLLINPEKIGFQWQPDMDIDSQGRVHLVYYDDKGGSMFRPFYRLLEFSQTNQPVLGDPIDISNSMPTSNAFTRPGDYFTVRVDSKDIPHVVWTDGRNTGLDIYYAHGSSQDPPSTTTNNTTTTKSVPSDSGVIIILFLFFSLFKKKRKKAEI